MESQAIRCFHCARPLELDATEGPSCQICESTQSLGLDRQAVLTGLARVHAFLRFTLTQNQLNELFGVAPQLRFQGNRAPAAKNTDRLRRKAIRTDSLHEKWLTAGRPPVHRCRRIVEGDDERDDSDTRPVYMPYRDVFERWDYDPAFYRARTQGMLEEGKRPWTREDMVYTVRLLDRSRELGLAGRQAPNPGAMPLRDRLQRGLFTFSGPSADGQGTERTTLAQIERATGHSFKGERGLPRGSVLSLPLLLPLPPSLPPASRGLRRAAMAMPPRPRRVRRPRALTRWRRRRPELSWLPRPPRLPRSMLRTARACSAGTTPPASPAAPPQRTHPEQLHRAWTRLIPVLPPYAPPVETPAPDLPMEARAVPTSAASSAVVYSRARPAARDPSVARTRALAHRTATRGLAMFLTSTS